MDLNSPPSTSYLSRATKYLRYSSKVLETSLDFKVIKLLKRRWRYYGICIYSCAGRTTFYCVFVIILAQTSIKPPVG